MPVAPPQPVSSWFTRFFSPLFTSAPVKNTSSTKPSPSVREGVQKNDSRRDFTRAIFQALPDLMFVFDRKGTFVDYKPAHFGGPRAPAEQFIGRNIAEVLPLHVTEVSIAAMQQAFAHGGVRMTEYEGVVNGKEHIFEARYIAMNKNRALAIIRDITDRREIEERLERRNVEMNTLLDNLLLGVIMENEGRIVTHINDEAIDLFKLSIQAGKFENHDGAKLTEEISKLCKEPERFVKRIDEIAHHLEKVDGEEWELKDGRVIELEYMPICHEGVCHGHLWMYRDITEHKKIDQMKSEFVSVASHQLRTPLTGIKWMSELLIKEKIGPLNADQRELVNHLVESNKRMVSLVNDLLDVSRIEAGKMNILECKKGDVIAFIDSIFEELNAVAAKKKVRLVFSSHPKQLQMFFDAPKLRQVMINIISNAIKYSPEKSKVELGIKVTKTEVVLSCHDQGIGIPSEEQSRLFEKFFRASNALKCEAEGSGLGLYIAKSLIELQKGKLWFESTSGKGTIFYVSFPLKK